MYTGVGGGVQERERDGQQLEKKGVIKDREKGRK